MRRCDIAYHHIRSLPTIFMDNEQNAEYHLKNLCPGCKLKESRYVPELKDCLWKYVWELGIHDMPRGLSFWDTTTLFLKGEIDINKYIEAARPLLVQYL